MERNSNILKPFKCLIKNKIYVCQILTVANTEEDLIQFINEIRPRVPKLNQSDMVIEDDQDEEPTERDKLKKLRKIAKAKAKKSLKDSTSTIVAQYEQSLNDLPSTSRVTQDEQSLNDLPSTSRVAQDEQSLQDEDGYSELTDIESPKNGRDAELSDQIDNGNIVERLKLKLLEERRERLKAVKAVNILRERNEKQQIERNEEEHEREADKAELNANEKQREMKGFPKIINTHSGLSIKKSSVEEAYNQKEPSKFFISMMYAAWGRRVLSERCIKKNKKNEGRKDTLSRKKEGCESTF